MSHVPICVRYIFIRNEHGIYFWPPHGKDRHKSLEQVTHIALVEDYL